MGDGGMNGNDSRSAFPQSMRHKRILDLAEDNPSASVDELASMVASVTPELVEHVLAEYGDPVSTEETPTSSTETTATAAESLFGDRPTAHGDTSAAGTATPDGGSTIDRSDGAADDRDADRSGGIEPDRYPTPDDLSDKQREVLAVVATHPEATQQEIADRLDVSRATVCNRVNSIEGFDWSDRTSFVGNVFDEPPTATLAGDGGSPSKAVTAESDSAAATDSPASSDAPATTDLAPLLDRLETCVADLEARVADLEASRDRETDADSAFADPELVHKLLHACLNDDNISEGEELRILKALVT